MATQPSMAIPQRLPKNHVYPVSTERNNANDRPEPKLNFDTVRVDLPTTPLPSTLHSSQSSSLAPLPSMSTLPIPPPRLSMPTLPLPPPPSPPLLPSLPTALPQPAITSQKPFVGPIFVQFGQERLGRAVFEVSGIDLDTVSGAPGILGIEQFRQRFAQTNVSRLADIKKIMIKYWQITNFNKPNPISEPSDRKFRVPCDQEDIDVLIRADIPIDSIT
jgi:hypothetical protein